MQSLRKYIEHMGLTGSTVLSSTRTIVSPGRVGRFLAFTLFHEPYHGVHHKFARLPHSVLPMFTADVTAWFRDIRSALQSNKFFQIVGAANPFSCNMWEYFPSRVTMVTRLRFLAMAQSRLGHADEARRCLTEATRWMDEANSPQIDDPTDTRPAWGAWHERIVYPLVLAEAGALVHGAKRHQKPLTQTESP